ncbi:cytidylyltransferase [Xylariaceae sp. FL0594]|nr:cytidylyltransferase [Xylariaceae sp. FL0594]
MSHRSSRGTPRTPRIISPSPTPSDSNESSQNIGDDYLGPVTRSSARRRQAGNILPRHPILEKPDEESDSEVRRARARSRSPRKARQVDGPSRDKADDKHTTEPRPASSTDQPQPTAADTKTFTNGVTTSADGLLAPPSLAANAATGWNWRDFSRSPSPFGLIPIHRHFQTLIHRHEVPRKVLHVSIGFFVYYLYVTGTQTSSVPPYLMAALIPIATTDFLRHKYASLNRVYVKYLGALMRETEYAGWNGVIFYLLGAWIVLRFFPKDVSVVAVMLLSWCDTAASTFGRLYGRYTPRIRRGKSLAGSLAAFLVGVATAAWFWGSLAPRTGPFPGDDQHPFMFQGVLRLPAAISKALGFEEPATLGGAAALGIMSLWSGLVAAGSEVIDLFGWDDNLTIPVLSGVGIWSFLKIFG